MVIFYIQYVVIVYLENLFFWNFYVICLSKIDDGVCLGFWDRVKVFLVFGVKISLLKKWVYICKNLECVFYYFIVFFCEQILFVKLKFFFISFDLKYG